MMEFTPMLAFGFVALTFAVGDYIALRTKGIISTFVTAMIVFVLCGGVFHLVPDNLIELSGLTALIPTFGMVLILTNLGSTLDLNELKKEWRTILVALAGLVGVVVACMSAGSMLFGKEYAMTAIAPISGGIVATMVTTEAATEAGRADLSSFASAIMALQMVVGLPFASFFLRKAMVHFLEKGGHKVSQNETKKQFNLRLLPETPKSLDTQTAHFARLALIGVMGQLFSNITGVNATICYLLFGTLAGAIGLLDKNSLKKAGGDGVMLLATYAYCSASFVTMTLSQFISILAPIFGLLLLATAGIALCSILVGKIFHWDPCLSLAVGLCCMLGYPVTYAVAMEVVNGAAFGKNYTPEEMENMTNYVLPKMLISGVVSVSVASVLLASAVAPYIFG